ncbi:MAG: hypothetical protein WAW96_20865 [Alphaproteobacteria bacterium]
MQHEYDKQLRKLAGSLPVAPWVEQQKGFGLINLGLIVGEAGDLSAYSNPAKLWKRFGLAVMPDGGAQRKFADKEKAEAAGFNPRRRAVAHILGDCLIKKEGQYRALYLARKAIEATRLNAKGDRGNAAKRQRRARRADCCS